MADWSQWLAQAEVALVGHGDRTHLGQLGALAAAHGKRTREYADSHEVKAVIAALRERSKKVLQLAPKQELQQLGAAMEEDDADVAEIERQVENCRRLATAAEERLASAKRARLANSDAVHAVDAQGAPAHAIHKGPVPSSAAVTAGSSPY